ncbi:MAG: RtcB family protein [Candidatus Poribacteria bacterium]
MESNWQQANLRCQDFEGKCEANTGILHYIKLRPSNTVYKMTTECGDEIIATADHPFWTKNGMVELEMLQPGDEVAMYPFMGVPYEEPSDDIIVGKKDIEQLLLSLGKDARGNGLGQILNQLEKRELLPLRYNSPQLPYLLKILGYVMGDGNIHYVSQRGKGITWFYGKVEDLENIRADITKLGFTPSKVYLRDREHHIETSYDMYEFATQESCFKVCGSAFATLLVALGAPLGRKTTQDYEVPAWIFKAPLWQKRLFLAALFGAELSAPKTVTGHPYNFFAPMLSMNKRENFIDSGRAFLGGIAHLLAEFDVAIQAIGEREEQENKDNSISHRLRLMVSSTPENLIKLWGQIGFEYHTERRISAKVAVQYLKHKQQILERKENAARLAIAMHADGIEKQQIFDELTDTYVGQKFIERSIYEGRKTKPRIGSGFPTFEEYRKEVTEGLSTSGMVWERISNIEPIPFDDYVYDFTVNHSDHNFIANGFVVSNCGVRLLRTNLHEEDHLFEKVPCGVGSKGAIRLNPTDQKRVLRQGARWAVENGYGREEDLECTEEQGQMKLADPDAASRRALERGKNQLGTLGSGNHFLEIQVVDRIFNQSLADVLGLEKGQIVIMIHSGSRGFGHQVCDEFVRTWAPVTQKYGIEIPDRQLVCAPVNSPEGQQYIASMACAANYAWANRQCIMHWTREAFAEFLGMSEAELGLELIYDVAHNIGKFEEHIVNGGKRTLFVHRKGATRAFPPGHKDVPAKYRSIGQPVIIPGDMGTASHILVGTQVAMDETWGTTAHGAGRLMSRRAAIRATKGRPLQREMEDQGIFVRYEGRTTLQEEYPDAYKDVDEVVKVTDAAGISKRAARMRPLGVIKG